MMYRHQDVCVNDSGMSFQDQVGKPQMKLVVKQAGKNRGQYTIPWHCCSAGDNMAGLLL